MFTLAAEILSEEPRRNVGATQVALSKEHRGDVKGEQGGGT